MIIKWTTIVKHTSVSAFEMNLSIKSYKAKCEANNLKDSQAESKHSQGCCSRRRPRCLDSEISNEQVVETQRESKSSSQSRSGTYSNQHSSKEGNDLIVV